MGQVRSGLPKKGGKGSTSGGATAKNAGHI